MFHKIDLNSWPRAEEYYYFSQMAPTGYSLTVNLDITNVLDVTRKNGLKFFPAYLWLVTRNVNKVPELKCGIKDGTLGYYDSLTPMYAAWHDDTKTFSLMWTEFKESFSEFYAAYIHDQKVYGDKHSLLSKPGMPPENCYTVSALPWIEFEHFAVHSYEKQPYYFPSIEAGKYYEDGDKVIMPLSITCHHATTDGWHVKRFLEELEWDVREVGKLI